MMMVCRAALLPMSLDDAEGSTTSAATQIEATAATATAIARHESPAGHTAVCRGRANARQRRPIVLGIRTRKNATISAQIYRLLQRLSPEVRRTLLIKRFSQAQRLSLERWILSSRAAIASKLPLQQEKLVPAIAAKMMPHIADLGVGVAKASDSEAMAAESWRHPWSIAGVRGIQSHRHKGRLSYCTSVSVGPFSLHSRKTADFKEVLSFRRLLLSIQSRIIDSCGDAHGDCGVVEADALCAHLRKELEICDQDGIHDLGLRCVACIPAKHWVGKALATPRYALQDLQKCLIAWRRLHDVRCLVHIGRMNRHTSLSQRHSVDILARVWQQLRATYVNIWVEAGHQQEAVLAKIQALEDSVKAKQAHQASNPPKKHHCSSLKLASVRAGRIAGPARRIEALLKRWKCGDERKQRRRRAARHVPVSKTKHLHNHLSCYSTHKSRKLS